MSFATHNKSFSYMLMYLSETLGYLGNVLNQVFLEIYTTRSTIISFGHQDYMSLLTGNTRHHLLTSKDLTNISHEFFKQDTMVLFEFSGFKSNKPVQTWFLSETLGLTVYENMRCGRYVYLKKLPGQTWLPNSSIRSLIQHQFFSFKGNTRYIWLYYDSSFVADYRNVDSLNLLDKILRQLQNDLDQVGRNLVFFPLFLIVERYVRKDFGF